MIHPGSIRTWSIALWLLFSPNAVQAAPTVATTAASGDIERFALAVGANDGGPDRELLRYAATDAQRFVEVMQELGGVSDSQTTWLAQPEPQALLHTLAELGDQMRLAARAGKRVQFIFYYSGHSDRAGLRLQTDTLTYQELRARIAALPAEVKIGILDSCESGAFTRLKGGVRKAPFLIDRSNDVEGHAFLTSSAEHEAAQESDRIAGSFFTHALISGLRGAADVNSDGKVTLSEAYRFAFDETLARTQNTRAGVQHPAYDIRLAGTGDVVMTDLHAPSALLSLEAPIAGRVYIRDGQGALVAELAKSAGRVIDLGLPPGAYSVHVQLEGAGEAQIVLREGERTVLRATDLSSLSLEATALRGSTPYDERPLAFSIFSPLDTNPPYDPAHPVRNTFGLILGYGDVAALQGLQLGLGVARVRERTEGVQATALGNVAGGDFEGIQASSVFNYSGGPTQGVQATSVANIAGSTFVGVQASGAFNLSAGLEGVQAAGGLNLAEAVSGVQAAPLNFAKELSGIQLGVVNIGGRVHGLQLGVINYADNADAQVGVFSLSREHGVSVQFSASDLAPLQLALRFNAGYTYGLLLVGGQPFAPNAPQYLAGVGLGVSGELMPGLLLESDLVSGSILYHSSLTSRQLENLSQFGQLRLLLRYRLGPVSLFGGPTLTTAIHKRDDFGQRPGFRYTSLREVTNDHEILVRPGFALGVQVF